MRKIGLIFVDCDSEVTKKTTEGIKEMLEGYEISAFEASNDVESSPEAVEECVDETEIPILVIDASKDTDYLTVPVIRMFELINNPLFMITNFEDADSEELAYLYNMVGDILLDTGVVSDLEEVDYKTVFFSPERKVAFTKVVESDSTNADALVALLENY